ncbi:putative ribonuclease H-like domain-containing protein [Tanacetum coccineum]
MRPFGCPVTILNTIDHLSKFDRKADEGFFVGYSTNNKAFRVFNIRTKIVEENLHVQFSETTPNITGSGPNWLFDIDTLTKSINYKPVVVENQSNGNAGIKAYDDADSEVPSTEEPRVNQEKDANINNTNNINIVSPTVNAAGIEDNVVDENIVYGCADDPNMPNLEEIVYSDDDEDNDAEADMNNLNTFMLVSPIPTTRLHKDHPLEQIIRDIHSSPQTKRMTKSVTEHEAMQEELLQFKNKARLVSQGYTKEEGVDYVEVFAPVSRIEAIRLFLAYASYKDFVVYQMDVKSVFLYGKIEEEVYVCQPPGFEDPYFPDRVYKVEKALYGLHQAPRAWVKGDILLVQVYVDDIIFGSTKKVLCTEFEKLMHKKFQMSSMGKITFFLGLQVTQTDDGIFISQDKDESAEDVDVHLYISMIGSLMYLTSSRPDIMFADSPFDLEAYTDSDYAGASLDRKSTTGVDFLNANPIRYALTVSSTIHMSYIEQFWSTAKTKTVNNETQIRAKVDGKTIVITESSVRRDLHFNDEDGIACLTNTEIFENLQLMGYENLSDKLTFYKSYFSPQWKYLIHTILQCLSSKSTAWNEFGTNIASAVICLAKKQKFNFSKLIFDGMLRNLDPNSKKFLMYPRFLQLFLNNQIENLTAVFNDEYDTPSHTKKVFANMRRQGKDFSGTVTPLFATMLIQSQAVEGEGSGQPTEPQHTPTTASPSHVEPIPTIASSSHPKKTHKHRKTKRKATEISQSSGPTTLVADETVHEERGDSMERAATTAISLDTEQGSGSGPRRQDTILRDRPTPTRFERLSKQSNDPPLSRVNTLGSGEDSMKLNELMEIVTKLSERVLVLENIKTAQDLEITNLKKRVKKLEKKTKSRTSQLKRRLFKVRIKSSAEKSLGDQEYASKLGRNEIDQDEGISWFQEDAETQGSTPPPTTTTFIEDEDLIIAQTLMKIRSVKSKEKSKEKGVSSETATRLTRGVIMKEASKIATRSIVLPQQRPIVPPQQQLDPKDKGKGIMQELDEEVRLEEIEKEEASTDALMRMGYHLTARMKE